MVDSNTQILQDLLTMRDGGCGEAGGKEQSRLTHGSPARFMDDVDGGTIGKMPILIVTIPGAWKLPQGERTSYNVALPTLLWLCTGMSVSFLSWGSVSEDI